MDNMELLLLRSEHAMIIQELEEIKKIQESNRKAVESLRECFEKMHKLLTEQLEEVE